MCIRDRYKTADINALANTKIKFNAADLFAYKSFDVNCAGAFKATDDLNVGFAINGFTITPGEKDAPSTIKAPEVNFGTTTAFDDIKISAILNSSFISGDKYGFQPGKLSLTMFKPLTGETDLAVQFGYGRGSCTEGDNKGYVDTAAAAETSTTIGTSYKLSGNSTLKSKLAVGTASKPSLDFAWVQKLNTGSLTLNQKYGADSTEFGMAYTLEA
eukprot:TRINITY_DN98_c0_g1_i1.p1 TRINITY_DN98_c0_g1~~TRINITY_DN98_c0_g1_i1.p1  ORF type:complete len:215 (-),score=88.57 TRINITY_DN98_c0_g1_i1:144-788(-)